MLGVHSLNRFVFSVPDLDAAQRFYTAFGLDARRSGGRLAFRLSDTSKGIVAF